MSWFISAAHAQDVAVAPQPDPTFQLVLLFGLFLFFYFVAIRPQRKRQKEHREMLGALKKGDEVVTTAGMLGKITKIEEDFVVLQVADNVELKFQKVALHAVLPKGTLKSI